MSEENLIDIQQTKKRQFRRFEHYRELQALTSAELVRLFYDDTKPMNVRLAARKLIRRFNPKFTARPPE